MQRSLSVSAILITLLAGAVAQAGVREVPETNAHWIDVWIARRPAEGPRQETVLGLTVGTDGGRSKTEYRVGDYSYSVGVRMDPAAKAGKVFEISVWAVRKYGRGPAFVELSSVHRVALRTGVRAVLTRRLHGGETTDVSVLLRR